MRFENYLFCCLRVGRKSSAQLMSAQLRIGATKICASEMRWANQAVSGLRFLSKHVSVSVKREVGERATTLGRLTDDSDKDWECLVWWEH